MEGRQRGAHGKERGGTDMLTPGSGTNRVHGPGSRRGLGLSLLGPPALAPRTAAVAARGSRLVLGLPGRPGPSVTAEVPPSVLRVTARIRCVFAPAPPPFRPPLPSLAGSPVRPHTGPPRWSLA